jgi:hypothetical protein
MRSILKFLLIFVLCTAPALAGVDGLFGVELSKPFPVKPKHSIKSSRNTIPYTFLVPVPENYEIQHFQYISVTVSQLSELVMSIIAETPYKSMDVCKREREVLITQLDNLFPLNKDSLGKYVWRYKDENANKFADVDCSIEPNTPYPVLKITVIDMDEAEKTYKHFTDTIPE